MTSDNIYCSFIDSKGNVWFGTSNGGLMKYDANGKPVEDLAERQYTGFREKERTPAERHLFHTGRQFRLSMDEYGQRYFLI